MIFFKKLSKISQIYTRKKKFQKFPNFFIKKWQDFVWEKKTPQVKIICLIFFLFKIFNGREWALWGLFCQAQTYCLADLAHQVHPFIHSFIHSLGHNWLGVIQCSVILAYKVQPRYIVNWYVKLIWKNIPVWYRVWYQPYTKP
jgi:hypothetical protein